MKNNEKPQIKIKNLIEGKTLKKIGEYFETKTKSNLEQVFDNIRTLINKQCAKSFKVSSVINMVKYHRDIFDFEIICESVIDAIGPRYQNKRMRKWNPFPFNDKGKKPDPEEVKRNIRKKMARLKEETILDRIDRKLKERKNG